MTIEYLIKGMILGLSIAAPLGPIGILCINRTILFGKCIGMISGLGAATADAIYGMIASIGLTFVSIIIVNQQHWFQLVGAIFLSYLGFRIFTSKNAYETTSAPKNMHMKAFTSTLFLTLTNPMTILSFATVFSGLGIASNNVVFTSKMLLVVGVFLGSSLWWVFLSSTVDKFHIHLNQFSIIINKISGVILFIFSIWSFYEVLLGSV